MINSGYFDKKICKDCGLCCKQGGCGYLPSDFEKMSYGYLKEKLEDGKISIEAQIVPYIDSEKPSCNISLDLRARNNDRGIVDLISYDSGCSLLKPNGCYYDDKDRPSYDKFLKPDINRNCKQMIDQKTGLMAWAKHQDTLNGLVKYFSGMTTEERIEEDIKLLKMEMIKRYPKTFSLDKNGHLNFDNFNVPIDEETLDFLEIITIMDFLPYSKRRR